MNSRRRTAKREDGQGFVKVGAICETADTADLLHVTFFPQLNKTFSTPLCRCRVGPPTIPLADALVVQ